MCGGIIDIDTHRIGASRQTSRNKPKYFIIGCITNGNDRILMRRSRRANIIAIYATCKVEIAAKWECRISVKQNRIGTIGTNPSGQTGNSRVVAGKCQIKRDGAAIKNKVLTSTTRIGSNRISDLSRINPCIR